MRSAQPEPTAPAALVGVAPSGQQLSYPRPVDGSVQQTAEPEESRSSMAGRTSRPCGSGKKFKLCHGRNPNAS